MRPPPLNLLGLAPLARPPGWRQLPPRLGCPPGPGGVSTDLQTVLAETSKATVRWPSNSDPSRGHHLATTEQYRAPLWRIEATANALNSGGSIDIADGDYC